MKNNRIVEYLNKGFIILGAKEEDIFLIRQDLNNMNLKFDMCEGTYNSVDGISSFIISGNGKNCLKGKGIDIIKKYNQKTFLFKPPTTIDKRAYLINRLGRAEAIYNDYVINDREQSSYTELPSGDCFSFLEKDEEINRWKSFKPKSRLDAMKKIILFISRGKQSKTSTQ